MQNLWNDSDAAAFAGPLEEAVYGSRLLGADMALVLHGGGNTSVKINEPDIHGVPTDVLYVKGSGWDLATIEAPGFAPLRLEPVRRLAELTSLSDSEMVNQLRCNLLNASAPTPSVEAILHASLPFDAVQHSHADAVLALTNTSTGEARVRELWGDSVVVVPYVMPGFDLAKACVDCWADQAHDGTIGMILLNHGVFTFGETTKVAYDTHIRLITEAENYLETHSLGGESPTGPELPDIDPLELARIRSGLCACSGSPMVMSRHTDDKVRDFVARDDLAEVSQRGNATPDHIIRTKQLPMLGKNIEGYASAYAEYFARNSTEVEPDGSLQMLDAAPRVALDPRLGMLTMGRKASDADIAADIYHHTIDVIEAAEGLGGFVALPERDLFEVEYWELEQAKLKLGGSPPPMAGEIAFVTGAASGIGRGCAEALLAKGAAVIGLDLNEGVASTFSGAPWLGIRGDVTDPASVEAAIAAGVSRFGGVDMAIAAAGIFGANAPIADLDLTEWSRTLSINLDGVTILLKSLHPFLSLAPRGGRVVLIGSKNVAAPGKGAAAYSASKAAVTQLGRVAALEWADDGITVNTIHPDGVFDTGLWSEEIVAGRAAAYGLTPDEYKTRNLLSREITSADIGELVADMCGPTYRAITGAQIPVDGGSDRVI
ncbi:MAG: rhamnose utilization protein RhaD (predicted bifunctional aldolase and dehydrogenase) [Candidatus Poriferisodalaceae bacterium]|jgi:rhamnose utilization protein RhaD (predicted bifunctional aldolase and dehydrogenase)/NAD(P)-dependent dehydrogenase (short-subunit alcohol dehydrogenase family)